MRSLFLLFFSSLVTQQCHGFSSSVSVATTTTAAAAAAAAPASKPKALSDFDYTTENRLPYQKEGYNQWTWRGHQIDYIEMGDPSKPALLLIHGFGASAYHYRYNIPELARNGYHVFAFDMLGFGLSDKPIVDYNAEVWRDQSVDFIKEVIGKPCTIAGNSLGGFTALYASTVDEIKPMIQGTVLLNGAGRFRPEVEEPEETPNPFVERVKAAIQRFVIQCSFIYTKQPARIEQVLRQVYPVNADVVDEELVESIQYPSLDPNAAEVFYRVITRTSGQKVYIDDLLEKLEAPLLLCWGEEDPWIRSAAADKIQAKYAAAKRVSINAGHCPHDEDAPAVNAAIKEFVEEVNRL